MSYTVTNVEVTNWAWYDDTGYHIDIMVDFEDHFGVKSFIQFADDLDDVEYGNEYELDLALDQLCNDLIDGIQQGKHDEYIADYAEPLNDVYQ